MDSKFQSQQVPRRTFLRRATQAGAVSIVAPSVLALAGCAPDREGEKTTGGNGGALSSFTVAMSSDFGNLDPSQAVLQPDFTVMRHVYSGLVKYKTEPDPERDGAFIFNRNEIEPYLAEFEVSPDGRTIDFALRSDVVFPSGNKLTVDDVIYTFTRHLETNGIGAFLLGFSSIADMSQIEKVSNQQIRITLPRRNELTLVVLAFPDMGVLDSKLVESNAQSGDPWAEEWLKTNPAGVGSYVLTERVPDQSMSFEPNGDFFDAGRLPWTASIVPSAESRALQIQRGSFDFVLNMPENIVATLQNEPGVEVVSIPSDGIDEMDVHPHQAPFDDQRVRQAMWYSIPYDQLVDDVYFGLAQLDKSVIQTGTPGYDESCWPYEFDPGKAKSLLADAGYADGFETSLTFGNSVARYPQLAELLRQGFAESGIRVETKQVTEAVFSDKWLAGELPVSMQYGWAWIADAEYNLALYYGTGGAGNVTGYSNPAVDRIIKQLQTAQGDERMALISDAQCIIAPDAARICLAQSNYNVVKNPDLKGYLFPGDGTDDFRLVTG